MGQDDEDDAFMLQAKQQITYNVINKRKDQLHRWQSSEMNAEAAKRTKRPKVQFQDSDIFLSACMSGDEEEVDELLAKGADINTCTVDGLTALHQSVIDSKHDMVRFLCEKGADVNAQDNEGWTPLHAAACCGNVGIVRYLCQHGADLSIVNSDKELALDLADDEQCREFLEDDYKRKHIDIDGCREKELNTMLRDAKQWLNSGEYKDIPHQRTGGTAMHVAAARGYIQLLELLIKAGGNVRAQDKDGWTPLHAAAHWAEKDACKLLIESGADLHDSTYGGQDVLAVADKDVIDYLVELGEAAKNREKRKSPAITMSPLQEKNHRNSIHEEHIFSSERKKDLQHKDQHSENEFLHNVPSTTSSLSSSSSTTITIGLNGNNNNNLSSRESSKESDQFISENVKIENGKMEEVVEDEGGDEEAEQEEEDEEYEEDEAENEESEVEEKKRESVTPKTISDVSRSVSRSTDGNSARSSVERETSQEASVESSGSRTASTTNSSRFSSSATPSSQRSTSMPPSSASVDTPRSSLENSSVSSGDQNVSATVPIIPTTAPPKAIHQSPSSWINRGFPLSSRSSNSSVSRSSSTPVSEIISPPTSLNSQNSLASSSHQSSVPSVSANSSTVATPISTPSTPVMSATVSHTKTTPSPAGSVTITATFSKPSRHPDEMYRSPSQASNSLPWSSLWHNNGNNSSTGQIRSQIEQFKNVSSSSLSSNSLPRVSAFRPPVKNSSSAASVAFPSSQQQTPVVGEFPRRFVPHQINPVKMSRWQSKTVNESEAERRNNSRMQRQHRRSTQGVTKEQLEEASRFATDEVSRRNSQVLANSGNNHTTVVRLASEEKDLSSNGEDSMYLPTPSAIQKDGDVSTTATVSLNSPSSNAANVRRKSQGLTISRSNRRATGPVNPEDLTQLMPVDSSTTTSTIPQSPSMGLRLAAASSQPYSPASVRSVAGTVPTMTSRYAEKAQSLPPTANGTSMPTTHPISSRSAIVAGLSPAPSVRTTSTVLPFNSTSRYGASSSLSSNSSMNPTSSYTLNSRPTETNLNYKALYEKEKNECEKLRNEMDDIRRSQTVDNWRGTSSSIGWRARNTSPSTQTHNLSVAKSTSLASFDENERKSMERKIADLESQLKIASNLRMENQRLKEENGALVRVISKMTI